MKYKILLVETQEGGCYEEILSPSYDTPEAVFQEYRRIYAMPEKERGYNTTYYVIVEE